MKTCPLRAFYRFLIVSLCAISFASAEYLLAQQAPAHEVLFRDVRVLDIVAGRLGPLNNVLIQGNRLAVIGSSAAAGSGATILDGHGQTIMPGLIDVHVHLIFGSLLL